MYLLLHGPMRVFLLVVVCLAATTVIRAQEKIIGSDTDTYDRFGKTLALSADGRYALIGVPDQRGGGPSSGAVGAVYAFEHTVGGWFEEVKLVPADADSLLSFGDHVALSGNGLQALIIGHEIVEILSDLVVTKPVAYAFERTSGAWVEGEKFDVGYGEVALNYDGTLALAGSPGEDVNGIGSAGAVHVYGRGGGTWTWRTRFTAVEPNLAAYFGATIDLSPDGRFAVVGAPSRRGANARTGAGYVFEEVEGVWTERVLLTAANQTQGAELGHNVAISSDGSTVLLGMGHQGQASIFTREGSTWEEHVLTAPDGSLNFGRVLDLDGAGNLALLGEGGYSGTVPEGGVAYLFEREGETWGLRNQVAPTGLEPGDGFGASVALADEGTAALMTAARDHDAGDYAGAVYAYTLAQLLLEEEGPEATPALRLTAVPNPFHDVTALSYTLTQPTHVVLEVFDALGRAVGTLVDAEQSAGDHEVRFDPGDAAAGVYFFRFTTATTVKVGQLTKIH